MSLESLPNELLKRTTRYLSPTDYMRLHRTSRLLYSKRQPYNFQAPTEDLDRFLRKAPIEVLERLVIAEWTEEAIVVAFVRGLPVCRKLIESGQVSDEEYSLDIEDVPDFVNDRQADGDEIYDTLVSICAIFGHTELLRLLLDNGFDIDEERELGFPPIACAILACKPDTCRLLIERGAKLDEIEDSSPLMHLAADSGSPEILEMLLDAGQDVNLDYDEETPLLKAAESGTVENVQWLLEHGADLWVRGQKNRSVLDYSLYNDKSPTFDYLLQRYLKSDPPEHWKEDALTNAAHACNLDACQTLLDLGANVNGNPQSSETPLIKSMCPRHMHKNQSSLCSLLLEQGAELYVGDATKECPLINAADSNQIDAMTRLIEKDPKIVEWACREGQRGALHAAAEKSTTEACQLLIRHGVDVNVKDHEGMTPLMHSTKSYNHEIATFLIQSGADLHIRDQAGWSVMEYACKERRINLVSLLRELGMQLPSQIPDKWMNGYTVRGASLIDWLRLGYRD